MPRRPDVDRPTQLETSIPTSLRSRLDLHLYSEVEGRIPLGAYKEFFSERIREYFESRRLELSPYGFPEGFYVYGPKDMIASLEHRLKGLK